MSIKERLNKLKDGLKETLLERSSALRKATLGRLLTSVKTGKENLARKSVRFLEKLIVKINRSVPERTTDPKDINAEG